MAFKIQVKLFCAQVIKNISFNNLNNFNNFMQDYLCKITFVKSVMHD